MSAARPKLVSVFLAQLDGQRLKGAVWASTALEPPTGRTNWVPAREPCARENVLFRLDLSHADVVAAGAVLAVSTLPLMGIGVLASVLPLLSLERGQQMTVAVEGVLLVISGVYYPVSVLPGPLQLLARISPLTYALDGIRSSLIEGRGLAAQAPNLLVLTLMGAVLLPAGMLAFGWVERRAKRLGLLKRSG